MYILVLRERGDAPMTGREEQLDALARDVLRLSRNTLLVNLRFLDAALSQFTLLSGPWALATDGQHIYYDPRAVLRSYRAEREGPVRDYLHMVLHCVFRHNLVNTPSGPGVLGPGLRPGGGGRHSGTGPPLCRRPAADGPTAPPPVPPGPGEAPDGGDPLPLFSGPGACPRPSSSACAGWCRPTTTPRGICRPRAARAWAGRTPRAGTPDISPLPGAGVSQAALSRIWKEIAARMQTDLETFSAACGGTGPGTWSRTSGPSPGKHTTTPRSCGNSPCWGRP